MRFTAIAFLIFTAFIAVCLAGCKKYPDGRLINLESKNKRMKGVWEVESFLVDGHDSTAAVKAKPFYGNYLMKEDELNGKMQAVYVPTGDISKYNNSYEGYWEFRNHKKDLFIHFGFTYIYPAKSCNTGPYGAPDITWHIQKLESKHLWLKTTYEGREYDVKLYVAI